MAATKIIREKWLWLAVAFPTLVMLPILIWPHYGLFSDAGQAIEFPREVLNNLPYSLQLLRPLEDGRWNPLFHGITISIYALAPDSPRALYIAQWVMLVGSMVSLAWIVIKYTHSKYLATLIVLLCCFGSGVLENYFTLDKVEPRIALYSMLAVALLVGYHAEYSDINTRRRTMTVFVVLQLILGLLIVFSKETGIFLAAALVGTWISCKLNPQWGRVGCRLIGIAAIVHVSVVLVFFALFKFLSVSMSYRYVTYDVTLELISRNIGYYLATSPELAIGVLCGTYWILATFLQRLPGPLGAVRVILVLSSFAQLIYISGISFWRWALDYYLLPAQFMANLTIVLTISTLFPAIRLRPIMMRIGVGIAIMLWVVLVSYRVLVGGAIYAQDATKDHLAQLLSAQKYYSSRVVLPLDHPDNAEIGERLEYFINKQRPARDIVDLYNFWEIPFQNRDNIQRFSGGAGIPPGLKQLRDVAAKPEKYVLWQFGNGPDAALELMRRAIMGRSDEISWSPEDIWRASYLRTGDLLLVPVGNPFLQKVRARGIRLYGRKLEDFKRRLPLDLVHLDSVRGGFWLTELGWDVLQVVNVNEGDRHQPYSIAMLLANNARRDIVPINATTTLVDEHRLPAFGLLLGAGWYGLEGPKLQHFRWMGEKSEIVLTQLKPGACSVEVDIEPALKPDSSSFVLSVNAGDKSTAYPLHGRKKISVEFNSSGKRVELVRFEALGGMTVPPPGDHRLIKARAFSLRVSGECVSQN